MSIEKLVLTLKNISQEFPLNSIEWNMPSDCPIEIPNEHTNGYEKNIYLKENFHPILISDSTLDSHYWIIQKWGGIGGFKKNDRNNKKIRKFLEELQRGHLTKDTFDCISSLSKVASFLIPNHFVIYDSRVIYALNWLLFNTQQNAFLFPQPNGRSSELAKYDMQTIFRLAKKPFTYRSHKNAYHDYCRLINTINAEVFGKESKPYLLEMLLFMIAPSWAVERIEQAVTATINIDNAISMK